MNNIKKERGNRHENKEEMKCFKALYLVSALEWTTISKKNN